MTTKLPVILLALAQTDMCLPSVDNNVHWYSIQAATNIACTGPKACVNVLLFTCDERSYNSGKSTVDVKYHLNIISMSEC
eukprot:scaffold98356_cov45-Prasinocladus_malaysianus.AAC.1